MSLTMGALEWALLITTLAASLIAVLALTHVAMIYRFMLFFRTLMQRRFQDFRYRIFFHPYVGVSMNTIAWGLWAGAIWVWLDLEYRQNGSLDLDPAVTGPLNATVYPWIMGLYVTQWLLAVVVYPVLFFHAQAYFWAALTSFLILGVFATDTGLIWFYGTSLGGGLGLGATIAYFFGPFMFTCYWWSCRHFVAAVHQGTADPMEVAYAKVTYSKQESTRVEMTSGAPAAAAPGHHHHRPHATPPAAQPLYSTVVGVPAAGGSYYPV